MRRRNRTFIDEDFEVKASLFKDFPIKDLVSWSHLKLVGAVSGIELNIDFLKFIITGASIILPLYNILIDGLKSGELDNIITSTTDIIDVIYKMFTPIFKKSKIAFSYAYNIQQCTAKNLWYEFCKNNNVETNYLNDLENDDDKPTNGYKLFELLDTKFPLALVKFYDKRKRDLHFLDEPFVNWFFKRFELKVKKNPKLGKIYSAMMNEANRQRNLVMYMN